MSNLSVVAIYIPFIVATVLIIVSIVGKDISKQVLQDYLLFCMSLLGWQITESLFYIFNKPSMIELDYNIKLVFVSLCGVFLFRVVTGFYKLNKIPVWLTYAIFAIPAITVILCFTNFASRYLRTGFEVTSLYPLNQASFEMGIWFDVNTLFANLMVVVSGIFILLMHFRLPKAYRNSSIAFMIALLLYVAGYVLTFITDGFIDFIMLGSCLANLPIYFIVAKSKRGDYLSIARREIFNYLDDAVFILDEKDRIVDMNKSAKEWFNLIGMESTFISFGDMIKALEDEGLIETSLKEDESAKEIKFVGTDILLVYAMNEIDIYDDQKNFKGKFVTLEDVTRNSLFIDRLEIDAGLDPLTGLQNRYTYEELLVSLNKEENLPISVILGDVNSLKYINDHYGHTTGDALLSSVGDVIRVCCPENGYAARIGGDEFVIMIPNCDSIYVTEIVRNIRNELGLIRDLPFEVKMALGCVTKTKIEGNLKNHVNEADRVMYDDKTKLKETGE